MRSTQGIRTSRKAITFAELLIAALLTVLIFSVVYFVLSRARLATQKGYWIQGAIQDLRNASRRLSGLMKKTSYPSTIEKAGEQETVLSYKEWREYDDGGRLRKMIVKSDDKEMDLYLLPGNNIPQPMPVRLLLFPICTPEKGNEDGSITWVEVVLEPSPIFSDSTPLGQIRLILREDSYNTKRLPRRAYDLKKKFSESLPVKTEQILIRDVSTVDIRSFSTDETVGISVAAAKNSQAVEHKRKRFIVAFRIECLFPKDDKVVLPDRFTVVNNIDVNELRGGFSLEVLAIYGDPPTGATVSLNGKISDVCPGTDLPGGLKVASVFKNGITVQFLPGNHTRSFTLK